MGAIRRLLIALLTLLAVVIMVSAPTSAQQGPNIVIIWGDDIGQSDISAYSHGLMGFKTPNIDRLANEGVMFTDSTGVDLASFCKRSRPVLAPIHIAVPTSFRLGVAIPQLNQAHFQLDLSGPLMDVFSLIRLRPRECGVFFVGDCLRASDRDAHDITEASRFQWQGITDDNSRECSENYVLSPPCSQSQRHGSRQTINVPRRSAGLRTPGGPSCGRSCCCCYSERSVVVPPGQHRNRLMRERYANSWPRRAPVHRSGEMTPILTSA